MTRRSPPNHTLLALAGAMSLVCVPALADEKPAAEATPASDAQEDPAAQVADERDAPEAAEGEGEDGDSTQGNAALAAGGVVLSGKGFPLGANFTWSNSLGVGNLLPGHKRQPNWTTSLSIGPTLAVPKLVDWQPNLAISGGISLTMDILSAYRPRPLAGPNERQIRLSDSSVTLLAPGLLKEPFTGITFTPFASLVLPTSIFSRHMNRLFGNSGGLQTSWSTSFDWLGSIGAQWRLGGTGWAFSQNAPTMPCGEQVSPGSVLPSLGGAPAPDYPTIVPREDEYLTETPGQCRIPGRQWFASVANSGRAFWNFSDPMGGGHTFVATLGLTNVFLRPLEDRADLNSPFAMWQSYVNTTDYSSGSVQYNYKVPVDWNVQVTAGMSSFQPMWDYQGNFRFPWFDFALGNQFTQGFMSINFNI